MTLIEGFISIYTKDSVIQQASNNSRQANYTDQDIKIKKVRGHTCAVVYEYHDTDPLR